MPHLDPVERAACNRRSYLRHRERVIARTGSLHGERRNAIRLFVAEYLARHPCIDCGESDPIVLDFDHLGDKSFNINRAVTKVVGLKTLAAEIAKCAVRCANCHRRKTHANGTYRSKMVAARAEGIAPITPCNQTTP